MIGKPEWFKMRKYGGWGITPKTWQGWVYVALLMLPLIIFHSLPYWNDGTRLAVTVVWIGLILFDVTHIMLTIKKDERERKHEIMSDRNALWFILVVLVIGLIYDIIKAGLNEEFVLPNLFIMTALLGGALVKSITFIYLDKKD